jgi:methylmalonyl-CoA mutase C-terminal domain/subunit
VEARDELVRRPSDPFLRTPSVDIGAKVERLGSKATAIRERPKHEQQHTTDAGADAGTGVNLRAMAAPKIRILVAKPGLDGHDRGAKVVARALRDAGFEVVYTGLHQTPEMIAITAVQEDVDAVGLSIMSGAHNTLFPAVLDALEARGANDIIVFGGGIIPEQDVERLLARGVGAVFTPGAPLDDIVTWIRTHVKPRSLQA